MSACEKYLQNLKNELNALPKDEVDEIIQDQKEFLWNATNSGKSEEEAVEALGSPKVFAKSLLTEFHLTKATISDNMKDSFKFTWNAVWLTLVMTPMNFLLIVGPFLVTFFLIVSGWIAFAGLFTASIIVFFIFIVKLLTMSVGFLPQFSFFLFTIALIAGSTALFPVIFNLTKFFFIGVQKYIRWNLKLIKTVNVEVS